MIIGYARVSTHDQNLNMQMDALNKAGCEQIFTDKVSGAKERRAGLEKAFNTLKPGDTLVVWKLDRLGRSIKHLIEIVNQLKENGISFRSLKETLDTTTSTGKLIFHIFASLAEFEKDLILERTQAGLKAARARGRLGGRPKKMDDKKLALAVEMMKDISIPVKEVCDSLNVSKSTLYRYLRTKEAIKLKNQDTPKEINVNLYVRVERNSNFVRGMKKTRKQIDDYLECYFDMEKPDNDSWDYNFKITYNNDEELDEIIYDLMQEIDSIADYNNCWTEMHCSEINGERSW